MCLGAAFAQLEVTLALATISQRFCLELLDPTQTIDAVPVLTLQPGCTVQMKVSTR
jgi:cytochrome P450